MVTSKKSYFTVKRIALLSVLTAFVTVGRLGFALPFLPNIQPVTTMLIIITLTIGTLDGLVVAVLSLILSNVFLGMGPWVIMQIVSFAVIVLLTALMKPLYRYGSIPHRTAFALWAGITGIIYGLVISYLNYLFYDMSSFLAYYLNGLYFDLLHGIGNAVFFFILEPIIVPIIRKQLKTNRF
ncbi:ECF transporter S component [Aerococcaceae bacterium DSM 111020]|nr:ECF transporter S component [Aerococcaceae bacterium DSM 111020]